MTDGRSRGTAAGTTHPRQSQRPAGSPPWSGLVWAPPRTRRCSWRPALIRASTAPQRLSAVRLQEATTVKYGRSIFRLDWNFRLSTGQRHLHKGRNHGPPVRVGIRKAGYPDSRISPGQHAACTPCPNLRAPGVREARQGQPGLQSGLRDTAAGARAGGTVSSHRHAVGRTRRTGHSWDFRKPG